MFAGAPLSFWIGFHVVVAVVLAIDLAAFGKRVRLRVAVAWMGLLALLAAGFGGFLFLERGKEPAMQFFAGYLIEGSLSIDNLFVFVLLFQAFALGEAAQRRALHWGVLGAIVLRAGFIFGGVALLGRFHAAEYVFGAILLAAAVRLMREKPGKAKPPRVLGWLGLGAGRSPLLVAIVAVELTDLFFAFDSVPAVLGVTRDPFLAYTSNIFAILGLRSLYFVLAGLLDRLRLLHYGLALVLAFVGGKMLATPWVVVPTGVSLGVVLGILAVFTGLSLRPARAGAR
jgi:tellurite resistance protein TerC